MNENSVGIRLRELREKFGYTQQHLANVLSIDRSTYSYYETGKTSPDIPSLITLSHVFSVSLEYLLGDEQKPSFVHDSNSIEPPALKSNKNASHIYDLTKEEKQIICFYRAADPEIRKHILEDVTEKSQK